MSMLLKNLMLGLTRGGEGDDDTGEAVGTGNDDRIAKLNAIGDNADRNRVAELADVNDDDTTSEFVAPAAEQNDDAEAQAAIEAQQVEADRVAAEQVAAESEAAPAKIIRKVNGQEVEITDEMIVKAQKIAAADVYLAEAKRTRDELATQRQTTNTAAEAANEEEDLLATARALQMGTEEEAVAALRKLTQKNPSIDMDDVSRKIDEKLTFNQAYAKFNSEYGDIVGDPVLKGLAQSMDARMLAAGDTRSYSERFTDIGGKLREWVASKAPVTAAVTQETKQERKAAAPSAPKAASSKHEAAVEVEQEESTQDVIAAMAAKRGGPQWMNGQSQNR